MIELYEVDYHITGRKLLSDVTLAINKGDRMAIVGRNGCGKSSLMKILAGTEEFSAGKRSVGKDVRVLLVKQEIPDDDVTPLEFLQNNDSRLSLLYDEVEVADNDELEMYYNEIGEIELYYEQEGPKVLAGLGLNEELQEEEMRNLSGGLRMRIAIASALLQKPDVLLLDEPTNHLDLESSLWLVEFLKAYKGTFVIISHDVKMLNTITNSTCHIHGGNVNLYKCSYEKFVEVREIQLEHDSKRNEQIDAEVERLDKFVKRFKSKPSRTGQCTAREKLMVKMKAEKVEIIPERPIIPIHFPEIDEVNGPLIRMSQVCVGYGERVVLKDLEINVLHDSRIGLLGRNGQGKSTLAKLFSRRLDCMSGDIRFNPRLRIGYCSQDLTDELDVNLTVYEQLAKMVTNPSEDTLRSHLAHYGFDRDQITTLVGDLSGGEKTRLTFAIISYQRPNLVILDEPTNHLDIESRAELIKAIDSFPGAVIIISHDWDFMEKTAKEFWVTRNGKAIQYFQGLDHYKDRLMEYLSKKAGLKGPKAKNGNAKLMRRGDRKNGSKRKGHNNGAKKKDNNSSHHVKKK